MVNTLQAGSPRPVEPEATTPVIELDRVTKRFGQKVVAVDDLSLSLEQGQFLALLGPSGCGKSTTLRLLAGLDAPDSGEIRLQGRCVACNRIWEPPHVRRIGMVFQDYALFPHLSVAKNIAFPLTGIDEQAKQHRVEELLEIVGLQGLAERFPHQLSGGQQQRVALARALAPNPEVLLLDEPFSNLDAALRESTREEVKAILAHTQVTTILVTHDQEEALSMADSVAVMFDGKIVQVGTPEEIYLRPAHREIATFVGAAKFVCGHADGKIVECPLGRLRLAGEIDGPVQVLLRPDLLTLVDDAQGTARVVSKRFFGPYQMVGLKLADDSTVEVRVASHASVEHGDSFSVRVAGPVVAYPTPAEES